jgi:hypothetical protein
MRKHLLCFGLALAMLPAVAGPAHGQERTAPDGRPSWTQRAGPVLPRADETGALQHDRTAGGRVGVNAEDSSEVAASAAVLDEAFWRQVLAGVIVTVVSTLILRAIL